jgi:hypothetical protein
MAEKVSVRRASASTKNRTGVASLLGRTKECEKWSCRVCVCVCLCETGSYRKTGVSDRDSVSFIVCLVS